MTGMEAPDAKRPRLDHGQYLASGSSFPRSATTPTTSAAFHHIQAEHPPSAPPGHSFPPPPPLVAPPQVHTSIHSSVHHTPYSRENGSDPTRRTSYQAATTHAGNHDHRPSYGSVMPPQARPYHRDSASSQTPPPPTLPLSAGLSSGPGTRRRASSGSQEQSAPMEHHRLPPPQTMGAQTYSIEQQHTNGGMSNGMPYHTQEAYAVAPVAHQMGYPPTPATAYPQTPIYQPGPANFAAVPRRKQVRATQACNNCRQRKQKCDEQRPCGYCKSEALDCQYREVPPPKTDRHIMEILDGQAEMKSLLHRVLQQQSREIHSVVEPKLEMPAQSTPDGQDYMKVNEGPIPEFMPVPPREPDSEPEESLNIEETRDLPPSSHDTGAQYLMKWPIIEQYFKSADVASEKYLNLELEKSGTLRLWGSSCVRNGQIAELFDQEIDFDNPDSTDPAKGFWGEGAENRNRGLPPNVGGLNPDRTLDLMEKTVRELYESYIRNMWTMHPILHYRWLESKIDKFIDYHSPYIEDNFAVPTIPASARPETPITGIGKRKRQSNTGDDHTAPTNTPIWAAPRHTLEKSMENAVILLVLALGKILSSDKFILEELAQASAESSERSFTNSPMDTTRPSPRSYGTSEAASSPRGQPMARASSTNGHSSRDGERSYKNMDLYPGLGYFAQAVEILGCNLGGTTIIHAQAFLLAGLYYGQLGRVHESWSWIYECCKVATILHTKPGIREFLILSNPTSTKNPDLNTEQNMIATIVWSAIQLESDLRAELDQLPAPSQLMFVEPKIARISNLSGVGMDQMGQPLPVAGNVKLPHLDPTGVLKSYQFQIYFRLSLNRVHAQLYARKTRLKNQRHATTTTIFINKQTRHLLWSLMNERRFLSNVTSYGWEDSDPPAADMLSARLRAKYYGGVYIILRPFIFNALHWQVDTGQYPNTPFSLSSWLQEYEDIMQKASAIRQETRRRGEQDLTDPATNVPTAEVSLEGFQSDPQLAKQFLWSCKMCLDAAVASTIAFDGVADPKQSQRLRVTNIHGTATAQFSNMLILVAVTKSWLAPLVNVDVIKQLMQRTLIMHEKLSPLSSIFRTNLRILQAAAHDLHGPPRTNFAVHASPGSMQGSSMSPASANTPRVFYGIPPPTSMHSSFNSVKY